MHQGRRHKHSRQKYSKVSQNNGGACTDVKVAATSHLLLDAKEELMVSNNVWSKMAALSFFM